MDLHEGPISGPKIEGPHSSGGSTQVHEGPHRYHGNVLNNAKHGHGPIKVIEGPQGTSRDLKGPHQDFDPKSRVQNVVLE